MKIITKWEWERGWMAIDDDTYDEDCAVIGCGKTEAEAVEDLKRQIEERAT